MSENAKKKRLDYTLKLINQDALLEYVLKIHAFISFCGWWEQTWPVTYGHVGVVQ